LVMKNYNTVEQQKQLKRLILSLIVDANKVQEFYNEAVGK